MTRDVHGNDSRENGCRCGGDVGEGGEVVMTEAKLILGWDGARGGGGDDGGGGVIVEVCLPCFNKVRHILTMT